MFVMAFARHHFTRSHKINCPFIETYESGSEKILRQLRILMRSTLPCLLGVKCFIHTERKYKFFVSAIARPV